MQNKQQLKDLVNNDMEIRSISENSFKQYDVQLKGYLVKEDFEKLLNDFAQSRQLEPPDQDILDDFFKEYADQDGKLNKDNFYEIIKQGLWNLNEFQN